MTSTDTPVGTSDQPWTYVVWWARSYYVLIAGGLFLPLLTVLLFAYLTSSSTAFLGLAWMATCVPFFLLGAAVASVDTPLLVASGVTRATVVRAVVAASFCLGMSAALLYLPLKILVGNGMTWYQVAIPVAAGFLSLPAGQATTLVTSRWGFKGGLAVSFLALPLVQTLMLPVIESPEIVPTPISPWVVIVPWMAALLFLAGLWWPHRLRFPLLLGTQK